MDTKKMISCALVMALALFLAACSGASEDLEGSNRVVVLMDNSGTFRNHQTEAIERAVAYLEGLGRRDLKRWETSNDKIAVISIDAMPDVIWEGNVLDLKKQNPDAWVKRFKARKDYSACTDVAGAFRLAAKYLDGDARTTSKYVLVFSDLIEELPEGSPFNCQPQRFAPAEGFPWEALHGVGITVLGIPAKQRLLWQRAASDKGIVMRFYTESETATAELQPPPKKTVEPTAVEQKRAKAEVAGFFSGAVKMLLMIPLVLIAFMATLLGVMWVRRRFGTGRPLAVPTPGASRRSAR